MQMKRKRGRPRKHPIIEAAPVPMDESMSPELPSPEPDLPSEVNVRMGFRSCMTSKGPSRGGNRWIRPGVIIPLPRHEAENLVSLGYATYA